MDKEVINWLLDSDPCIVFQTKRDLLDLPESKWKQNQKNMFKEGWAKQLLDLQDKDGKWGGGLYGPKFISTHYTLLLLKRMELLPNDQTHIGCQQLLNIPPIGSADKIEPRHDACITGMGLGILSHFKSGEDVFDNILEYLEYRKLKDGAWNCRNPRVKTNHSSMHTTISVLEGLATLGRNYYKYKSYTDELAISANEFLLIHELYKSHRTGKSIDPNFEDVSFPPRWKYNILSALDYFQSIKYPYDNRMADAINIVEKKQNKGYWNKGKQMTGKRYFSLNTPRRPSEFNTLRALRALRQYKT